MPMSIRLVSPEDSDGRAEAKHAIKTVDDRRRWPVDVRRRWPVGMPTTRLQ